VVGYEWSIIYFGGNIARSGIIIMTWDGVGMEGDGTRFLTD
jgi:hypothetical protein